jgi:SAM-dependent methyltransferase
MSAVGEDCELRYLRHTPAGAEYVRQINAQSSDRRARTAFRDLVLGIATPGARLFDFGAGPGIDARFFAERGFTVDAYDIDPRMREFFADHCRDLIGAGRVCLEASSYRDFLTHAADENGRRSDLVMANFAPLNLVDDLRGLFAKFHALTVPQGKVLASVLNPFFIGDLRHQAWWRDAPRLWRDGQLFLPGPQAPHYRRLLRHFRAVSAPDFRLSGVYGIHLQRHGPLAWVQGTRFRYLFLVFDKTP